MWVSDTEVEDVSDVLLIWSIISGESPVESYLIDSYLFPVLVSCGFMWIRVTRGINSIRTLCLVAEGLPVKLHNSHEVRKRLVNERLCMQKLIVNRLSYRASNVHSP